MNIKICYKNRNYNTKYEKKKYIYIYRRKFVVLIKKIAQEGKGQKEKRAFMK